MHVMFGEDHRSVSNDIEDSLTAFDELGLDAERALDVGRQTGGSRQVLSTTAIGDGDLHARALGHGRIHEREAIMILPSGDARPRCGSLAEVPAHE